MASDQSPNCVTPRPIVARASNMIVRGWQTQKGGYRFFVFRLSRSHPAYSRMRLRLCSWVLAVITALNGCANHQPDRQPPPVGNLRYLDIQPGWRILVVAPILKSGGYRMQLEETQNQNGIINLRTGADFEGYQTDYYRVRASNSFLTISFRSGAIRRNDGSHSSASRPLVPLFGVPTDTKYVRLLFLTRSSDRDHDQAILAASSAAQLEQLTSQVEADPTQNCKSNLATTCSWVPAGVAVRPEKKQGRAWAPAR